MAIMNSIQIKLAAYEKDKLANNLEFADSDQLAIYQSAAFKADRQPQNNQLLWCRDKNGLWTTSRASLTLTNVATEKLHNLPVGAKYLRLHNNDWQIYWDEIGNQQDAQLIIDALISFSKHCILISK